MTEQITREQAEAALEGIKTQFAAYLTDGLGDLRLYEPGFQCNGWAIGWEEGPYQWTYIAFDGGVDEEVYYGIVGEVGHDEALRIATKAEVQRPAGVHTEPVNHWCLGLYPDN